jgi:hypothetical protein
MRLVLSILTMLVALPFFAIADPNEDDACYAGADPGPTLGIVEVSLGDPGTTFYFDDRGAVLGAGFWVYQESNGAYTPGAGVLDNLQRGGAAVWDVTGGELHSDICTTSNPAGPDTLIV